MLNSKRNIRLKTSVYGTKRFDQWGSVTVRNVNVLKGSKLTSVLNIGTI